MKRIEISARTVAEAVELALAQLGRDRDEVAIEVLDPGENGDEALVRVTVVEDEEETPSIERVSEIAQHILESSRTHGHSGIRDGSHFAHDWATRRT